VQGYLDVGAVARLLITGSAQPCRRGFSGDSERVDGARGGGCEFVRL
jgi:hypothetical protein